MSEKVMIVEHIEDIVDKAGGIVGKFCSNSSGDSVKVKNPRGSNLKDRWDELEEGMAYKFIMGEFRPEDSTESFPYVKDFTLVATELAEKTPDKAPPTPRPQYPQARSKSDDTNRSIIRQVSWKTAGRLTEALIASGVFPKDKLTVPNILATQKKIANAGVEWIMSSHEVAEKIQEEIDKQRGE